MSDYMKEAERLIGDLISAVDFEDQSAETKARSALLAHIERGRVPEGAKPAAWAVSGQDLSDYSVWRNEPDEEQLEILNSQCKDGPIIVRTLFFAAPAAPDHSATAPAEVPMPEDDMSDALGELAGVDTHDVNLRDNPESYEILGRLLHTYGDAREAAGYARGLKEAGQDAERYRWLRRHFAIVGTDNGAVFHALNLPTPTHIAPDAAIELDASIDAALREEVKP